MKDEVKGIKSQIEEIAKILKSGNSSATSEVAPAVDPKYIINDINVLEMNTRDCYQYGLDLMSMLFTREEMGKSLLYKSKRSSKPALDKTKVSLY